MTALTTVKLPFPLTLGFKSLFARDIAMPDLNVRWVSALSWYFLNLFGLNGVFKLILGQDNCECCRIYHSSAVASATILFPSGRASWREVAGAHPLADVRFLLFFHSRRPFTTSTSVHQRPQATTSDHRRPPAPTLSYPPSSPPAPLTSAATDARDANAMAMLSGAGGPPTVGPAAPDFKKLYKAEVENLAISDGLYHWVGDGVEDRVLRRWGKL